MNYQYELDTSSRKFNCPSCKHKTFVKYIDTETKEYLPEQYGRCDRESRCGYFEYPSFEKKETEFKLIIFDAIEDYSTKSYRATKENKYFYIPKSITKDVVNNTMLLPEWYLQSKPEIENTKVRTYESTKENVRTYQQSRQSEPESVFIPEMEALTVIGRSNNFIDFLLTIFSTTTVDELVQHYRIGSSKYWQGANIFFYVDGEGKYRRGKIMLYDILTGKRQKNSEGKAYINSVHSVKGIPDKKPPECLFGLHLTQDNNKPIAIVESEKTAIIASVFMPQFIWVATGYKKGLKPEMLEPIKNRKIFLFPDLGACDDWKTKAAVINPKIKVFDFLEKNASEIERLQGLDIADYLLRSSYPQEWDLPCERNETNDHWRAVNLWQNLEGAVLSGDYTIIDNAVEAVYKFYGEDAELPVAMMQEHAPKTFKKII